VSDHDHRGEYAADGHDHYDHAREHHRHYDLENDDEKTSRRITGLQGEVDVLRGELAAALERVGALEAANLRLAGALLGTAAWEESICRAGLASDERLAVASDLEEEFTALAAALEGKPDVGSGPDPDRPETRAFTGPEELNSGGGEPGPDPAISEAGHE
jgi:hypothetical protein